LKNTVRILKESEWGTWDKFVASCSRPNVHQLSIWGRFQASKGKDWRFWIIGLFDGEKLVGGTLILRRSLPFGKCWLYMPKGPLVDYDGTAAGELIEALLQEVKRLGKEEKAVFVRLEPGLVAHGPRDFGSHTEFDWDKLGFRTAHAHYQPEHTLIVDINLPAQDILAQMKSKGRYNIRLAEKKGVKVLLAGKDLPKEEAVHEFHSILEETTARDGFAGHPESYYLEMLNALGEDKVSLYLAQYEGKMIAGIVVTFYADLAIYYFGASTAEHRNVMAPYLLQWEAIQEAKKRGAKWYDFLGTAPLCDADSGFSYDEKHSWAGVTAFKLKFGGKKVEFRPGAELVIDTPFYWLMRLKKFLSRR
jgi:lipid II:glycine glycyltransferase (peptidoglycan interpeptide bridge formation enzyme)